MLLCCWVAAAVMQAGLKTIVSDNHLTATHLDTGENYGDVDPEDAFGNKKKQ